MSYESLYHAHAWKQIKPEVFLYNVTFCLLSHNKVGKIYLYFERFLIKQLFHLCLLEILLE